MDATTKKIAKAAETLTVSMAEARYGTPEPQITVRYPRHMSRRALMAALHSLAARVELETADCERWSVLIDDSGETEGRVYLELADGAIGEAQRGLAVLRRVVGR